MKGVCRKEQVLLQVLLSLFCCWYAAAEPSSGAEEGQTFKSQVFLEGLAPLASLFLRFSPDASQTASVVLRRASPCGDGSPGCQGPQASATPPPAESGPPPPLPIEVPDWSYGIYDSPPKQRESSSAAAETVQVDFGGALPATGSWAPATFSGYGGTRPIGPILLACTLETSGRAACDVVNNATPETPGSTMYNAWSVWGDSGSAEAYVSLSPVGVLDASGFAGSPDGLDVVCCELSNNAVGCVACTGYPSHSYNPLNWKTQQGSSGQAQQSPARPLGPPKRPMAAARVTPVKRKEIFRIFPKLSELLGGATNPRHLPCEVSDDERSHLPTLGDVIRSRKDMSIFGAMIENSHIQHLVPCPLTYFAVTDDNARDFQGARPPPCLTAALARPENQRDLLRLVGRSTLLGNYRTVPEDSSVPLLYGKAGKMTRRGRRKLWNNVELTGEKIVYNRGVIHFIARNDMQDTEGAELLRRIVYWSCLHEHLQRYPGLTRLALLLVDSNRPLPVLGAPPGPRPDWVARGNQGWTAPPASADAEEPKDEGDDDSDEDEEKPKAPEGAEAKEKETEGEKETEPKEAEKETKANETEKETEAETSTASEANETKEETPAAPESQEKKEEKAEEEAEDQKE